MISSEALLVSRNGPLGTLLRRSLEDLGIEVTVVSGVKAALHKLSVRRPALIFILVQQPGSKGFSVFTEVKKVATDVPIVLVTSTLRTEEFLIHQRLPSHADAYLDKQMLEEGGFAETVHQLLRKAARRDRDMRRPASGRRTPKPSGPVLHDLTGAFTQGGALETAGAEEGVTDNEASLRSEAEMLRRELETVRLAVSSSPFSETNIGVMRRMQDAEKTRSRLEAELEARVRLARELDEKLRAQEGRLRAARDRARTLEEQLRAEASGHEERERDLARQVEALESRLAAAEIAVERAKGELESAHQGALQDLRNSHAADLERIREEHAAAEREQCEKLEREHAAALAAKDAAASDARKLAESELEEALVRLAGQWQERLDLLQKAHEDAIVTAEKRQREEIAALEARRQTEFDAVQSRHATELEGLRREREDAKAKLSSHFKKDRDEALAANDAAWSRKLQKLEASGASALQAQDAEHRREVARLKAGHEEALAAMEAMSTAGREQAASDRDMALEGLSSQWQERLDRMEEAHNAALAAAGKRHGEELAAAAEEHQKQLRDVRARAAAVEEELLERIEKESASARDASGKAHRLIQAEKDQVLSKLRSEWQERLARTEEEHRREMDTVKAEHLEAIQEIQARDAAERERVQKEHSETVKRLSKMFRQEHEIDLKRKIAYWQDQLERVKEQNIRALHAERDQHQALLDALNAAKPASPRGSGKESQAGGEISKKPDLENPQVASIGALDDDSTG